MPVFEYKVRVEDGRILHSSIEAETLDQVRDALRKRGFYIVDIKAPGAGLNSDIKIPFLENKPPSLKTVALFARQLSTMINSGVPLVQALVILQKQTENPGFQKVVGKIRSDVESGVSFSEALANHPKVFSSLFLNLVRAGESSGSLDTVLDRVSMFLEKEIAIRGKIKNAMTYPVIVLVVAVGITYYLMANVVPQFATILNSLNAKLPPITQFLMAISDFIKNQTLLMVFMIVGAAVGYTMFNRTPKGREFFDTYKLKLPVFGSLIRRSAISSFARTFGLLLNSGVNIIESLEITKGTANNVVIEKALSNSQVSVMSGDPMSYSLAVTPVFPPMVTSMISIGEESGSLDNMLSKVADYYEREVDEAIEGLTVAIEPIMIVFLGGVVGLIVVGMFMPMFSIINTLSGS